MNWKKLGIMCLVIMISVFMLAPVADAKKKKKKKKLKKQKAFNEHLVNVGANAGLNLYGPFVLGNIKTNADTEQEEDVGFDGAGGVGPMFGLHADVMFQGLIVRVEGSWAWQSGEYDFEVNDKKYSNEFKISNWTFGGGIGKTLVKDKTIHPYVMGVLGYHGLVFTDEDSHDKGSGSGLSLGAIIGLDAKIPKMSGMVGGAGLRADFIYTLDPVSYGDDEATFGYVPILLFLNVGWLFG